MKDAFYFPHDSNAKDDPKCSMLIEQLGLEGYGIYWVLIETLRDQPSYRYPLSMLPIIARKYNTTAEKVRVVVGNYGLFTVTTDEFFLSDSLCRRMEKWDAKRIQASEAGKISAQKRLLLNVGSTDVQRTLSERSTNKRREEKIKEDNTNKEGIKKVKKEKKDIYGSFENVFLTTEEYEKLKDDFPTEIDKAIEWFSQYIEEKGYKSKSHYLAIRRWVIDAVTKNKKTNQQKKSFEDLILEG